MPILRHALKCTVAVVLLLLIVAWRLSLAGHYQWSAPVANIRVGFALLHSDIALGVFSSPVSSLTESGFRRVGWGGPEVVLGRVAYWRDEQCTPWDSGIEVPIPLIVTALIPLAMKTILSSSFRLWHYLGYTALVALELAYYLRWNE
jgi:hypothetical protein